MAKSEELRLDVEVKGARDVDKLATSLEDVEDASKRAAKALVSDWDQVGAQAKETATIMKTIGDALGQDASKFDLQRIAENMQKAGVDAKGAAENVELLADGLRRLDSAKTSIDNLGSGLDTTRQKMDTMRSSSDQSRSVLANLAGNTAQDLGQLGGVVGSLGVGIGQLAEYAVDGNIALGNLAKVAGPMVAVAAAAQLITSQMQNLAETKAFRTEQVKAFSEAIKEAGANAGTLGDVIEEQGELLGRIQQENLWGDILGRQETVDATTDLAEFGITLEDITTLFGDFDTAAERGEGSFERLQASLIALGVPASEAERIAVILGEAYSDFGVAADEAAGRGEFFATSLGGVNQAMQDHNDEVQHTGELWDVVLADLEDGVVTTDNAAAAWNRLKDILDVTPEVMAEIAQEKLDEKLEADRVAALALAEALADLGDVVIDIDTDDLDNIGSALTDALDAADATIDFQSVKENLRGAFDELETYIAEQDVEIDWGAVLDTSRDTGLPPEVLSQIADIRDQFQTGIGAAFDIGGAGAAQHFADTFIPALMDLGMSQEEAYAFVGLPPGGDIDVALKPFVDAEAKADALAILESLQGVDPDNPILAYLSLAVQTGNIEPQIAEIAGQILAGEALGVPAKLEGVAQADVEAALAWLAGFGVTVTLEADPAPAEGTITGVTDADYQATIAADADTAAAATALLTETSKPRTAHILTEAHTLEAGAELDDLRFGPDGGDRIAHYSIVIDNLIGAQSSLNELDDPRTKHIYIVTHNTSVGGGTAGGGEVLEPTTLAVGPMALGVEGGGVPGVAALAAPTPMSISPVTMAAPVAAAPIIVEPRVTIQAGVIGDRFAVQRAVSRALKQSYRLNGRRSA